MTSLLVRNVKPEVLERLKAQARDHGRSLQAEVATILEEHAPPAEDHYAALRQRLAAIRAATRPSAAFDAVAAIREDRDSEDHGRSENEAYWASLNEEERDRQMKEGAELARRFREAYEARPRARSHGTEGDPPWLPESVLHAD